MKKHHFKLKSKKVVVVSCIIVVALVGAIGLTIPKQIEVETVAVEAKDLQGLFYEDGLVEKGEDCDVTSNVSGKVLKIFVATNQYVKKGDVIATIAADDYDYSIEEHNSTISSYKAQIEKIGKENYYNKEKIKYNIQELEQSKQKLENTKGQKVINSAMEIKPSEYVETLSASVDALNNEYNLAKQHLEVQKSLLEVGGISEKEVQEQEANLKKIQDDLAIAKNKYDTFNIRLKTLGQSSVKNLNDIFFQGEDTSIEGDIKELQTRIESLQSSIQDDTTTSDVKRLNALIQGEENAISELNSKKSDCKIKAVQSGYITNLPIQNMSMVPQGTSVATIKGNNTCKVTAKVLTDSIPYLKVGDSVEITQKLKDKDVILEGKISEIYNYAEESTSALGLEEHRVKVVVELQGDGSTLKDGYEVQCGFSLFNESHVLSVPCSSIFEIDGEDYVFVDANGLCEKRKVTVEHKNNVDAAITEGLKEGEKVIKVANEEGIQEGIKIKSK